MENAAFERRRRFWIAVSWIGVVLALVGLWTTPPPFALDGVLSIPLRNLLMTWLGSTGLIACGLHMWYRADEYGQFYRDVDWSKRWGSGPAVPIPPKYQPYVNGGAIICTGLVLSVSPLFVL